MTNRQWLLLSSQPFLNDILPVFPKLTSVLDAKAVLEHFLDLLESKAGNLGVEEV